VVERQVETVELAVHEIESSRGICAPDHLGAVETVRGFEIEILVEGNSAPRPIESGSGCPNRKPRDPCTKDSRIDGAVRCQKAVQRFQDDGALVISIGGARMGDEQASRGRYDQPDMRKARAAIRLQHDPACEPQAPAEDEIAVAPTRETKTDERLGDRTAAEVAAEKQARKSE
jgi:hypothetical protein